MERNGTEWSVSGMERNGMEWSGTGRNGTEWNVAERDEMERNRIKQTLVIIISLTVYNNNDIHHHPTRIRANT